MVLNSDGLPNLKGKMNRLDKKHREERKEELVSTAVLCSGTAIIKNNISLYLQLKLQKQNRKYEQK